MSERALRVVLAIAGAYHLALGLVALLDPGAFFEQIGRYSVRNDHYIGDAGAFYAASGVALLVAVLRRGWRVPLFVTGAVWYGVHALNHLFDVGQASSDERGIADTVLLALAGAGSAYLARVAARPDPEADE